MLFVEYEDLDVVRQYPDLHDVPPATYEEDKAWAESGQMYDHEPPSVSLPAEQALADSIDAGVSVVAKRTDTAFYPEGTSDEDLVSGINNPEDYDGEDPPGEPPTPNPTPTPRLPDRVLNTNPSFETALAPWTIADGSLERSTDRAHETQGVASAKVATVQGSAQTVVRSEPDLPVTADRLHGATGWFFPVATDVEVQYGIDWFKTDGSSAGSSLATQTLPRDVWTQISIQEFPPDGAVKAQLKLLVPDRASEVVTLYADELKALGPTSAPTPVPGLVAAYGMNEGTGTVVGDVSGKGNVGTVRDTSWRTGKYGQSLSFNGSSSWVTVADASSLRLGTKATLSAWVNPATVANWRTVVMKDLPETANASYGLYASNGVAPSGWLRAQGVTAQVVGSSPLSVGAWSHVAVTYDGSTARLYVNGVLSNHTPATGTLDNENGPVHIGGNGVWNEYFQGAIDEVRIYNIAQTQGQIQADMNTPIGNPIPAATQALRSPAPGAEEPAVAKVAVARSVVVDGVSLAATRTPDLSVWMSGAAERSSAEFEIVEPPSKPSKERKLIWSGTSEASADQIKSLRVPAGKLRDGSQVRWRVRVVTGDAKRPWSEWQVLKIDLSAKPHVDQTQSKTAGESFSAKSVTATEADEIKRLLPVKPAGMSQMTYAECLEKTKSSDLDKHTEYLKNRFDYCWRVPWRARQYRGGVMKGEIVGVNEVISTTFK
ncbi:LamG domain-containing protein [Streptosporangium sp. NPDC023963]|uniref:LamG domain-containing protein n=1 Tax=Streptosporangium sp. NPDC023963 TaxID=3155608 RepID=UPI00341EDD53